MEENAVTPTRRAAKPKRAKTSQTPVVPVPSPAPDERDAVLPAADPIPIVLEVPAVAPAPGVRVVADEPGVVEPVPVPKRSGKKAAALKKAPAKKVGVSRPAPKKATAKKATAKKAASKKRSR